MAIRLPSTTCRQGREWRKARPRAPQQEEWPHNPFARQHKGLPEQTPNGMSATPQPPANILVGRSTKSYGAKDTTEKNNSDAGRLNDFLAVQAPSKYMTTSTGLKELTAQAGIDIHLKDGTEQIAPYTPQRRHRSWR